MLNYLKVHQDLEERRSFANESGDIGPRVLVAGPNDSGKTTLVRILCNLAVRMGWSPVMVNLDPSHGPVTVPGCLSASVLYEPWNIEEGLSFESPLAYYYGYLEPTVSLEHYKTLVKRLASVMNKRAGASSKASSAGMYIDTSGAIEGEGYELLLHQIEAFSCNVVIVIGNDKLYNKLASHSTNARMSDTKDVSFDVLKLPRSGGTVMRSLQDREVDRNRSVQRYFWGKRTNLQPLKISGVPISMLKVYRIGGSKAPSSALPIGASQLYDPLTLTPHSVSIDLENAILGVSHARTAEDALLANVAGFIQVIEVDLKNQLITYRTPQRDISPTSILISGNDKIKYPDIEY